MLLNWASGKHWRGSKRASFTPRCGGWELESRSCPAMARRAYLTIHRGGGRRLPRRVCSSFFASWKFSTRKQGLSAWDSVCISSCACFSFQLEGVFSYERSTGRDRICAELVRSEERRV